MRINEIEVISSRSIQELSLENQNELILSSVLKGTYEGIDIWYVPPKNDNIHWYLVKNDDKLISYLGVIELIGKFSGWYMAKQAWTSPNHPGKSYFIKLMEYAIKDKKYPMISDPQMSRPSITQMDKIIDRNNVKVSIYDVDNNSIIQYDNDIPIYDEVVSGYTNTATKKEQHRYVWYLVENIFCEPNINSKLLKRITCGNKNLPMNESVLRELDESRLPAI